jgi:hypothetical protein
VTSDERKNRGQVTGDRGQEEQVLGAGEERGTGNRGQVTGDRKSRGWGLGIER